MGNGGRVGMYINNQSCIPFIAFDNCGCFRAAIIIYIFLHVCRMAHQKEKKRKQSKYTSVSLKLSNTERENEREKVKKSSRLLFTFQKILSKSTIH